MAGLLTRRSSRDIPAVIHKVVDDKWSVQSDGEVVHEGVDREEAGGDEEEYTAREHVVARVVLLVVACVRESVVVDVVMR